MIGYFTTDVPLTIFIKNPGQKINLIPNVQQLSEVIIKPQKVKDIVIGREAHGGLTYLDFFSVHDKNQDLDKLGREIGTVFSLKPKTSLEKFRFYVSGNDFSDVKFRLNIYSIQDNKPYELLQQKDILFSVVDGKRGWVDVDLTSYDLYFEDYKSIAVTLQWIASKSNQQTKGKYFGIPAALNPFGSGVVFRDNSMDTWKMNKNSNPSINIKVKYPVE